MVNATLRMNDEAIDRVAVMEEERMAVRICGVQKGSTAARHGIMPGELLLSLNGHEIMDVLDYRFYEIEPKLTLCLQNDAGERRELRIVKREYDEIGLEFETYLMDKQRSCRNKCIFCFIDQLPKGMRESLYFKDDDSRLSFLFGNYITLTNLTEHEISRIIEMHISPINVSVHTTNPELRVKMMGNRFAGNALSILKRLAEGNIQINCQLVLCPGINDGPELSRTLADLKRLSPSVECVAAVPLGVTKYREGLYPLQEYDPHTAAQTLDLIEEFGEQCLCELGTRFVYPADEFYLKANRPIPAPEFYEAFDQLENGVGLLALLKEEFHEALAYTEYTGMKRTVTVATGVAAQPLLSELLEMAKEKYPGVEGSVVAIKNDFFGESITVAGLVTGGDLIRQLRQCALGDEVLIPAVMLRREGDLFLDDVTLEQVGEVLGRPVRVVENDGQQLLNAILGQ